MLGIAAEECVACLERLQLELQDADVWDFHSDLRLHELRVVHGGCVPDEAEGCSARPEVAHRVFLLIFHKNKQIIVKVNQEISIHL